MILKFLTGSCIIVNKQSCCAIGNTGRKKVNMNTNYLETVAASLYDGGWRACDRLELVAEYGFSESELDFICCYFQKWRNNL